MLNEEYQMSNHIEWNQQRILTTDQLAQFYGVKSIQIQQNFGNNKEKFVEGKHYYLLQGEELKDFKDRLENFELVGRNAGKLILYTKQGASRHSKMLNTNRAWDMFELLEESYFTKEKEIIQMDPRDKLKLMYEFQEDTAKRVDSIETEVKHIVNTMRLDGQEEFEIKRKANAKIVEILGGKKSKAYETLSKKVFSQFWNSFKKYFSIPRYGELPKKKFEEALEYIDFWQPETELRLMISKENKEVSYQ